MYLVCNASGRQYERWANHFDPYSPIYSRRERAEVLASDFALGLAFAGLCWLGKTCGWLWLLKVPLLPQIWTWPWPSCTDQRISASLCW